MKLTNQPCRIVGLRVGEIAVNLLHSSSPTVHVKFVLLRDPSTSDSLNSGSFTKTQWSPEAIEAFHKFVDALENDAVHELFGESVEGESPDPEEDRGLKFPSVAVLGGPKRKDA